VFTDSGDSEGRSAKPQGGPVSLPKGKARTVSLDIFYIYKFR